MELTLGVIAAIAAVGLLAFAIGSQIQERAGIRSSLRRVEGYDMPDTRDRELLAPLRARTLAPAFRNVLGAGRAAAPTGYVDRKRKKLVLAGHPGDQALDTFLVFKGLGIVLSPFALLIVYRVLDLSGLLGLLIAGISVAGLAMGADVWLDRRVEARVRAMQISLPEILDLLVISVEAGLGFEQALDRVVQNVPGPLTDEFSRMLGEVRAGASRADAMRAMEARIDVPEVRAFILAMLQADTFGVSIGKVLRVQADEMRVKRRQIAQELAQKAPVKMLIPMVFCIFPALFVVVIGPAVMNIIDNF